MIRGDFFLADLGDPIGHEAGDRRPVLLISATHFHQSGLCVVLPTTRTKRSYPTHVEIDGSLTETSYVQCEQPRTISSKRLIKHLAHIASIDMFKVERALSRILALK